MLKSMTGYGRGEAEACGLKFSVELKSVNHRFCEVVVRTPRVMSPLEDRIRRTVQNGLSRGRVDVFVSMEETEQKVQQVKVDKALAVAYYKAMEELRHLLPIGGEIELKDLYSQPNIFILEEAEENLEEWWPAVENAVTDALNQLVQMRLNEGSRLAEDISKRAEAIGKLNEEIRRRAPLVVEEYRQRLNQRLAQWRADGMLDENRMAAEVAVFAERANITEETVRLKSHLSQMMECLRADQPVGRKLDFLVQEMNREINTIGSKANDLQITNAVLSAKSELEKIREQVQNIE
ncbi:YicC/YloC family endoribonuclease [Desulfofalx alkaliphila]|uniref:YicC/YloC family endoribonuclease n=1 Tax=Desulfofalx alkaliphila TaxID=105483 RepID=UPI0004E20933|nr:YicC/YloC family endoribonuclease [Desulfofalx alkaliphila]